MKRILRRLGKKPRLAQPGQPGSDPRHCRKRLRVIKPYLAKGGIGAELGVFKGAFIDYLLTSAPKKLYIVDPWFRLGPRWEWAKGDKSTINAFVSIMETFRHEIEVGLIEPRVEFSQDFLRSFPDRSLDWLYIDTSHTYEQTLLELTLASKKVKDGSYIVGDDYSSDANTMHSGVYRAVTELAGKGLFDLVVDGEAGQFVARV